MNKLSEGDQSKLFEIFRANQNLPGAPSWTESQLSQEITDQFFLEGRNAVGELTAFILFRKTPEAYEISYLATHPQAKRKGVMAGLLRSLVALAKVASTNVWLEVHESNLPAQNLYKKIGFIECGRRPKYYPDGGSAILYNYG